MASLNVILLLVPSKNVTKNTIHVTYFYLLAVKIIYSETKDDLFSSTKKLKQSLVCSFI